MESHKRILGILYIVSGTIQLFIMAGLTMFVAAIFPWLADQAGNDGWVLEIIGKFFPFIFIAIILVFSLPTIIGGIGLLQGKSWALTLVLVMGCFKLFSFPIGTALGIYAIWVYAESNKPAQSY